VDWVDLVDSAGMSCTLIYLIRGVALRSRAGGYEEVVHCLEGYRGCLEVLSNIRVST